MRKMKGLIANKDFFVDFQRSKFLKNNTKLYQIGNKLQFDMTEIPGEKSQKKSMPMGCGIFVFVLNIIIFAVDTFAGTVFFAIYGFWFLIFVIMKMFDADF